MSGFAAAGDDWAGASALDDDENNNDDDDTDDEPRSVAERVSVKAVPRSHADTSRHWSVRHSQEKR